MIPVSLSEEIINACPDLHVMVITCRISNTESDTELWREITEEERKIRSSVKLEEINKWTPVFATRQVYKKLGKDPNRYRPSAEALRRRILRELPLYKIDTAVDITNLISIRTGYSIGGFDIDKIDGPLILGVGKPGEVYRAIGRGKLNIDGLPVYRDNIGGVGTPTSDEERTKININTTRLLLIINGYSGREGLRDAVAYATRLLIRYVSASQIEVMEINALTKTKIVL